MYTGGGSMDIRHVCAPLPVAESKYKLRATASSSEMKCVDCYLFSKLSQLWICRSTHLPKMSLQIMMSSLDGWNSILGLPLKAICASSLRLMYQQPRGWFSSLRWTLVVETRQATSVLIREHPVTICGNTYCNQPLLLKINMAAGMLTNHSPPHFSHGLKGLAVTHLKI